NGSCSVAWGPRKPKPHSPTPVQCGPTAHMKIALVCPYDYTYPGAVAEHISHLATEFVRLGHEVHLIAPSSGEPGDESIPLHRLGRPVPFPANGSVARIAVGPRLSRDV